MTCLSRATSRCVIQSPHDVVRRPNQEGWNLWLIYENRLFQQYPIGSGAFARASTPNDRRISAVRVHAMDFDLCEPIIQPMWVRLCCLPEIRSAERRDGGAFDEAVRGCWRKFDRPLDLRTRRARVSPNEN
jgi:hypothetical protein